MSTLNFALMGCGRIASRHAEILSNKLAGAKLTAVCDTLPEKANKLAQKYKVPAYNNIHDLLNNEKIDVVNILTPSGYHAKNVLEIAKYKKHIVVEKPMALTLDDADKMIDICDEYGIKLFVIKQNRYNLPIIKLKQAISDGRFGKLVMGTVRVRWCRTQEYYDQDNWRGTWALDGGVLTNQASHHIDLLEWVMGKIESVFAKSATRLVNIETEDTGIALLKFCNGSLGIIEATTATRPKDLEGSISILGENGTVVVGGFAANELITWNFNQQTENEQQLIKQFSQNPPNVYGFGHLAYLEDVIKSIQNNQRALVDGLEGRKSLEIIHAIYESIETGKEVFLRFNPKKCKLGKNDHE
ncbi:MAG: Gfo/Idh/MocA family oxidoreductase [Gammaproteobacteria bacterium]|jgi:predicted dehydrogenase